MRFAFTPERLLGQTTLRSALARECPPSVVRASWENAEAAAPVWKTLCDLGLVALGVPEAHGGLGLDALDAILLFEECGRSAAPGPIVETSAVATPLLAAIEGERAASALSAIANEGAVVAVDLDRAGLVLGADVARFFILRHADELHLVAREGVTLEACASVDRSRKLFRISWNQSDATLLARGPRAIALAANAFDRGAVATSAELIGLSRRMVDMTVEHAKTRKQFGAPIGSFQAVKHHLASALVKIELARPAVLRAAHSIEHRDADSACHASIAKAAASDAALFAGRVALQCHGAMGYSFEHDLHLWMKRAWALASSWGDAGFHRARVATTIMAGAGRGETS